MGSRPKNKLLLLQKWVRPPRRGQTPGAAVVVDHLERIRPNNIVQTRQHIVKVEGQRGEGGAGGGSKGEGGNKEGLEEEGMPRPPPSVPVCSALLSRPLISLANNMPAALPPAPSLHDRMDGLAFLARSLSLHPIEEK